jgi:hypothetical protein
MREASKTAHHASNGIPLRIGKYTLLKPHPNGPQYDDVLEGALVYFAEFYLF